MARQLRIEYKGAFYHVTSRGNRKQAIFLGDLNCLRFLDCLAEACETHEARFHAYCLMENHFHLMAETPRGNLSQIMHFINTAYSTYHNKSQDRFGHLFQGRFKSILIEADAYAQRLSRYIHMNPVRAKIVQAPGQYRWSSYSHYTGLRKSPPWLATDFILGFFSQDKNEARRLYQDYAMSEGGSDAELLRHEIKTSPVLGSPEFIEKITNRLAPDQIQDRELPDLRKLIEKHPLNLIQIEADRVLGRNNKFNRDISVWFACKQAGYVQAEVANFFDLSQSTVSNICRRTRKFLSENEIIRQAVLEIKSNLIR